MHWANVTDGTPVLPPDRGKYAVLAVKVRKNSGKYAIESHSFLDGDSKLGTLLEVGAYPAPGIDFSLAMERKVAADVLRPRMIEQFPSALSESNAKVFPRLGSSVVRLILVDNNTKIKVRHRDDLSDGVASIVFYLRAEGFNNEWSGRRQLLAVAHEFHHTASYIASDWGDESERTAPLLKRQIIRELAARLFASCVDLELSSSTTPLFTDAARVGGRRQTMTDDMIADFLSPEFDQESLGRQRALELLKGYQLALYWTIWTDLNGNAAEIRRDDRSADAFSAICAANIVGSQSGLISFLKSLASDGVDAPEFDIPAAQSEMKRRYGVSTAVDAR